MLTLSDPGGSLPGISAGAMPPVKKGRPIMPETPAERTLRARNAALSRSAVTPGADISAPARAARLQKYYDATDSSLPERERRRQAEAALRRDMTALSLKAAKARRAASSAARAAAEVADAASQLAG
jgi:hypothetical protein